MELKMKSWADVTIGTYQELCNIESDNELTVAVNKISILCDTDSDTVRKTPLKQLNDILKDISFVNKTPNANVNRIIEVEGVKYGFIPDLELISTGEFIDAETFKNDSINNLHYYAALLYRPVIKQKGDEYEIEEHDVKGFMKRADLFKEKLSIEMMFGAYLFFSLFVTSYLEITQDSLMDQVKKIEKTTKKKKTTPQKASKKSK